MSFLSNKTSYSILQQFELRSELCFCTAINIIRGVYIGVFAKPPLTAKVILPTLVDVHK